MTQYSLKKKKLSTFLQTPPKVFLYKWLGWNISLYLLLFLGNLYFFLNREEKRNIVKAIEAAFSETKDVSEIRSIVSKVMRGILYHYYEKLFNAYEDIHSLGSFLKRSIDASGIDKLDRALEKGRGTLFVTGHYGGIEYIPIFLAINGYPISVVVKFATKQLKDSLYAKTKGLGLRIIDADQKVNGVKAVAKELRANRIVFIECDELKAWKPSNRESTVFLGKTIGVDKTISVLQRRTGADIIFGILRRFNLQEYSLIVKNYEDMLQELEGTPSSPGETVLKFFERYVYSYPEEWYQWAKYAEIETRPDTHARTELSVSHPFTRHAVEAVS